MSLFNDFDQAPENRELHIVDQHDRHIKVFAQHLLPGGRVIIQCSGFGGKRDALGVGLEPGSDELAALIAALTALHEA